MKIKEIAEEAIDNVMGFVIIGFLVGVPLFFLTAALFNVIAVWAIVKNCLVW